jgi:hemerythrin-like domain-containing protein
MGSIGGRMEEHDYIVERLSILQTIFILMIIPDRDLA